MKLLSILRRNKSQSQGGDVFQSETAEQPGVSAGDSVPDTDRKKKLLVIVGGVVVFALGFAVMGIIIPATSRKPVDVDLKVSRQELSPGQNSLSPAPVNTLPVAPQTGQPSTGDTKTADTGHEVSSPSVNSGSTTPGTKGSDVSQPAPQRESAPVPAANPFSYDYDRDFARKKVELLKKLELEKIEAEIREAQQRGKNKGNTGAVALPAVEKLPRIKTNQQDTNILQNLQQPLQPQVQQPKQSVVKIKIPGYTGVYIVPSGKTVVLDDGNRYGLGDYISDYLYIDEIASERDIYVRDRLGNRFKLKPVSYEAQVILH